MLALIFTVLASVCLVSAIILLGWFLIWKAFLSKFRLVRELLGQVDENELLADQNHHPVASRNQSHGRTRKVRKD